MLPSSPARRATVGHARPWAASLLCREQSGCPAHGTLITLNAPETAPNVAYEQPCWAAQAAAMREQLERLAARLAHQAHERRVTRFGGIAKRPARKALTKEKPREEVRGSS